MEWKPSNEPTGYDARRVAAFKPVVDAVHDLGLPMMRARKAGGVCNAIEMQIEDGGDSPEVNDHLLAALQAAVIHQAGEKAAAPVLRAIETFRRREVERWEQFRSGEPPPLPPESQLDDLVERGYAAFNRGDVPAACDQWLAAWEIIRQLAQQGLRNTSAFQAHYSLGYHLGNWTSDLEMELGNVGRDDPHYHERRLQFAREFVAQFSDEDAGTRVNFGRAQGEALWELGRSAEADQAYQELVGCFPDEAWGYIGWADQYWLLDDSPKDYARAEAIMTRAMMRPQLRDRSDLLQRLHELYTESGQPGKLARLETLRVPEPPRLRISSTGMAAAVVPRPAGQAPKLGRNDPCWCGSGRKYKKCHLAADGA